MFIEDYIFDLIIPLLEKKSDDSWNGRCVVCGDSAKSQHKKRFWIKSDGKGNYYVKCWNCNYCASFPNFLKQYFPDVHQKYKKDLFKTKKRSELISNVQFQSTFIKGVHPEIVHSKNIEKEPAVFDENNLVKLSTLPKDHLAWVDFMIRRRIPKIWSKYLFYTDNFKSWINEILPDKFDNVNHRDPRVVLPFYSKSEKKLFAVAGRALEDNAPRYMTIKFNDDHPKIFGLDRINVNKTIYVFEGPIDSLFIPNSIAMAGSLGTIDLLLDYAPIENFVLVSDIEPRNKEIMTLTRRAIKRGFRVALLPKELKMYGKDINDLIMNSNMTWKDIVNIINEHIVYGINGIIKFNNWRRVKIRK